MAGLLTHSNFNAFPTKCQWQGVLKFYNKFTAAGTVQDFT